MLVGIYDLCVIKINDISRNYILIYYSDFTYFKILLILKYSPLQPHSIINGTEERFSVGFFVGGLHFFQNYCEGVNGYLSKLKIL